MDTRSIISKVRAHIAPTNAELHWFANGLSSGVVSDAQAGAFAMAVCLNGLSDEGRVALTTGMRDSGEVLKWDFDGPILDKHSTGGVGDPVSLLLAPMLAACGVFVPMISGRGLGHTGGTLDKLEAITGVKTDVSKVQLRRILLKTGCAIVGATGTIAPADKRLYAIRDVTSTVESIDLITASILSKKLAAGLEGLVLDVKTGSGAFMKTQAEAEVLARALVDVANGAGCPTAALVTDMDEPLAPALGNAVEVAVCMEVLSGNRLVAPRLHDLTVALGARVLALSGEAEGEAEEKLKDAISSGRAMMHFAAMIAEMGGPLDMAECWRGHLPVAPIISDVIAPADGYISAINGEALGLTVVGLGGGRRVETDRINPAVGLTNIIRLGEKVVRNQQLCTIHAASTNDVQAATAVILEAISIGEKIEIQPLVRARIS